MIPDREWDDGDRLVRLVAEQTLDQPLLRRLDSSQLRALMEAVELITLEAGDQATFDPRAELVVILSGELLIVGDSILVHRGCGDMLGSPCGGGGSSSPLRVHAAATCELASIPAEVIRCYAMSDPILFEVIAEHSVSSPHSMIPAEISVTFRAAQM